MGMCEFLTPTAGNYQSSPADGYIDYDDYKDETPEETESVATREESSKDAFEEGVSAGEMYLGCE